MPIRLSVVIRAYNSRGLVEKAIQSLFESGFDGQRHELIIINDGSTDGTEKVLQKYNSVPGILIKNQPNQGSANAANNGFRLAHGEWLAILDSDDLFQKITLSTIEDVTSRSSAKDFIYFDYFESFGGVTKHISPKNVFECFAGCILLNREKFICEGLWNTDTLFPEYDLFLRTWGRWRGLHWPEPIFTYCRRETSLSADQRNIEKAKARFLELYPERKEEICKIRNYGL